MHCCRWTLKPSPRGEDLPRGPAIPVRRPVRPLREEIPPPVRRRASPSEPSPDSLLPRRPLPRSGRARVSQPCPQSSARLRTRKGCVPRGLDDATRRVLGTPRRDGAQSPPPRPAADLDDASRPRPGRIWPARPAQRRRSGRWQDALKPRTRTGRQGPARRRGLAPPSPRRGAETTTDGCCRRSSPFVNFVHPCSSVAVARRRHRRRRCRSRRCPLRVVSNESVIGSSSQLALIWNDRC